MQIERNVRVQNPQVNKTDILFFPGKQKRSSCSDVVSNTFTLQRKRRKLDPKDKLYSPFLIKERKPAVHFLPSYVHNRPSSYALWTKTALQINITSKH